MPIKYAQRPIFSGLRFYNESEISDSGPPAESPSRRDFYVLKKPIDLSRVWNSESWISMRARYPETSEADLHFNINIINMINIS